MTQLQQVRNHLKTHGEITSWCAIQMYGITRLSEYIRQLRSKGLNIQGKRVYPPKKNWFNLYTYKS